MILTRRTLLTSLLAAPLVVRSGLLMPVHQIDLFGSVDTVPVAPWFIGDIVSNGAGQLIGVYAGDGLMQVKGWATPYDADAVVLLPEDARMATWEDLGLGAAGQDYPTPVSSGRVWADVERMLSNPDIRARCG